MRISSGLGVLLGLLVAASSAAARSPSCEGRVERHTLKNGLEVVLAPDASSGSFAVVSSVHVGSRHDPPGYEWLAHYVEHLSCRSAPPFASAIDLYADAGGLQINATTSSDTTDYFAVLPAAQLERAIWIEARRLAIGLDAVSAADALLERDVVLREYEWRYGKGPWLQLAKAIDAALFAPSHPYHAALPDKEAVAQLTLGDARFFFARHYQTDRVRLVLLGGFDVAKAKVLIERHLGALPGSPALQTGEHSAERECSAAPLDGSPSVRRIVLTAPYRREHLELYWPLRADEDPELWRGAMSILTGNIADAAQQLGLSHEVSSTLVERELGSYWMLDVGVMPGQPFEKIEPLVREALRELRASAAVPTAASAARQQFELTERRLGTRLLERALILAKRECRPSRCPTVTEQFAPSTFEGLGRFELERALIVERRFRKDTDTLGSIEVVP